jgi:hypothetical protein
MDTFRIVEFVKKEMKLPIHLEETYFENIYDLGINRIKDTPLTNFLRLKLTNERVKELLYIEMPIYFKWDRKDCEWRRRKRFLIYFFMSCIQIFYKILSL